MSALDATVVGFGGAEPALEPASHFDREYWLSHCEGYRVDSPGGRIGLVEAVRSAAESGRAESLAVLAGMLGRRRLIISVSEVDAVVPHAERIVLKKSATLLRSERLGDAG